MNFLSIHWGRMLDEMRLNENYTGITFFHARGGPKSSLMSFYDGMGWTDTARPDPAGLRNFRRRISWGGASLSDGLIMIRHRELV